MERRRPPPVPHVPPMVILDPAGGRREVPMDTFSRSFTGVAVELEPGEDFTTAPRQRRSTWRYLSPILSRRALLLRIILVSAMIQLLGLAVPLMTGQVV